MSSLVTVPNFLTLLRIALTPFICLAISQQSDPWEYVAFGLFIVASITDFADGYLASRMNARSALGAVLDPLADKILVIVVLFFLVAYGTIEQAMVWPCALIVVREIVVLGMRSVYGAHRLKVVSMARGKTFIQFLSILLFLLPFSLPWSQTMAQILLWVSAILGLLSGYAYLCKAISYGLEGSKR